MNSTTVAGGVAVLALLVFTGALSFGLIGAVVGPIVGAALFYAAAKALALSGADDERDRRLVEKTRFQRSAVRNGTEREKRAA